MPKQKGISTNEKEQLTRYKQAMADIRYVLKQYKRQHPEEAWVTIEKIAHSPTLRLKSIAVPGNGA